MYADDIDTCQADKMGYSSIKNQLEMVSIHLHTPIRMFVKIILSLKPRSTLIGQELSEHNLGIIE